MKILQRLRLWQTIQLQRPLPRQSVLRPMVTIRGMTEAVGIKVDEAVEVEGSRGEGVEGEEVVKGLVPSPADVRKKKWAVMNTISKH